MKCLKAAFEERPQQWGLRADPYLWNEMQGLIDMPAGASLKQIHAHLLGLFAGLTGGSVDAEQAIRVDRYDSGGMSGGFVCPQFWRERAIPLLLKRCIAGQPLSIVCWNVNHRTGRTTYRPEATAAAMATGADVLVFTEFFPQHDEDRVRAELQDGGWVYQALSSRAAVRANQILVASRLPLAVRQLPPSTVDEHLVTNTLWLQVAGMLELLCVRVPTYTGKQRAAAWDWQVALSEEVRQQAPALLIGDLNTGMRAKSPMPQFHSLCAKWGRLQPTGIGSFFGTGDIVSEIDHALVAGPLDATAWYLRQAGDHALAGSPAALSDHAAVCVLIDLQHSL